MIRVDFYSKLACPNCVVMAEAMKSCTPSKYTAYLHDIMDHPEVIEESGAMAAPVLKLTNDTNDNVVWISGKNPDVLVDYIEGLEDIWV